MAFEPFSEEIGALKESFKVIHDALKEKQEELITAHSDLRQRRRDINGELKVLRDKIDQTDEAWKEKRLTRRWNAGTTQLS